MLYTLECADVQGVMVAPTYKHPDGKVLVGFDERISMCWDLVQPLKSAHCPVWVDTLEYSNWAQNGSGYTLDALKMTLNKYSPDTVVLVLGSDIKGVFEQWVGYDGIKELIDAGRVEPFWVDRVGGISSTGVRDAVKNEKSTARMLPPRIRKTIDEHGWYSV
jgi:nicotinic acid mononucleotide adenylyltransferase